MDFVPSSIFTQLNVGEIEKTVGYDREFLVKMVEYSSPYHVLQNFMFLGHDEHPNTFFTSVLRTTIASR